MAAAVVATVGIPRLYLKNKIEIQVIRIFLYLQTYCCNHFSSSHIQGLYSHTSLDDFTSPASQTKISTPDQEASTNFYGQLHTLHEDTKQISTQLLQPVLQQEEELSRQRVRDNFYDQEAEVLSHDFPGGDHGFRSVESAEFEKVGEHEAEAQGTDKTEQEHVRTENERKGKAEKLLRKQVCTWLYSYFSPEGLQLL